MVKTTVAVMFLALTGFLQSRAEDFLRNLPDLKFAAQLVPDKFKNFDAVIILKEQSLNINTADIMYGGVEFKGITMTRTTVELVKVFNESAIRRFGSFEFEYYERFGNEITSGFTCRARVQKPDGEVLTMPESDVRLIVSEESSDGVPQARKAIFKVPNLAAGDVVQIEYTLTEPLVRAQSGIFYFNDRYPVLFSNLSVTLPRDDDIKFYSFPAQLVGEPKISQMSTSYGAGETYFWGLKGLHAIPQEPYTYAFDDLSFMTAFVVNGRSENGFRKITDWNLLADQFSTDYVKAGSVKNTRIVELGFQPDEPVMSMRLADSLYASLRHSLVLKSRNSVYPLAEDIDEVFTRRRGDASDLAYIFYKILRDWKAEARVAWIRDRRQGSYETSVPTVRWFNRIGVLVKTGGEEKLYDFDRSVPARYQLPSYLKSVSVPLLGGDVCEFRTVPISASGESFVRESHDFVFGEKTELADSLVYTCNGTPAEVYRNLIFDLHGIELNNQLKALATVRCLDIVDTLIHSALLDEPEIRIEYRGHSKAAVATVDAYLTVKLPNEALRGFREQLFTMVRYNDIVLLDPLTVSVTWRLHVPAGYMVRSAPTDTTLHGVQGMAAVLRCSRFPDGIRMNASLKFTERVIPAQSFPGLIQTVDRLLAFCEQTIVLAKK